MPDRLIAALLDLIFPPHCVGCSQAGAWLCPSCLAQIDWIAPPLCPRCGEPLEAGARCPRWRGHPEQLDGLRSAAWHTGALRTAIHQFKYRGLRALAEPLGAILAEAWRRQPPPVDLLLPVPLHARRQRERGFNQSLLLSQQLSHATGLPFDARSLTRIRYTPPQVGLGAALRLANVRGAFAYRGPALQGRSVCLIDDIFTTGATLEACAETLRNAGARAVWAFTLARPKAPEVSSNR